MAQHHALVWLGRIVLGTAPFVGVAVLLTASPAVAACTSFAPASNSTVDCTGTSTQGVVADTSTGVIVGVHAAGSIVPAANAGLDPTHANWGIDVGTGAVVTVDNGGTVDTSARTQQSAIKLNSGSSLTINGTVKGDGGVVGPVATLIDFGFANSVVTVGSTGQVIATQPSSSSAALNGSGGGNTYQIDGFVQGGGGGSSGIVAGTGDKVTLGATGHIQSLGTANGGGIYNTSASNVVVTTAAGSLIESHNASGVSGAIDLGTNANVTAGGAIHVYPGSGSGIQLGSGGVVWLQSTGSIVNDAPPAGPTVGGRGIAAGNRSVVTVDGTINTGRGTGVRVGDDSQLTINNTVTVANGTNGSAFGASFGIGSTVVVGRNATLTSDGSGTSRYAAALGSELTTSSADHTVTIDIFGRVQHTGTGTASALYLEGFNHSASPVTVNANITVEAGGLLFSQAGPAYTQLDGFGGYPDVSANFIIAGDVETGVVGGKAINLDGRVNNTVTFQPTYKLVGSIDGGSNTEGLIKIATLAFDGTPGTTGTFSFDANPVLNFQAGHKTGAGNWILTGTAGTGLTGNFAVDGGRLSVNGSMTSTTFTVNPGGTLGGSGIIGSTTVNGGGTIAPGNSIGTLTVAGNILFAAGSIYEVEANAAGQADKTHATGAAAIQGGTVRVLAGAGNYAPATTYTILTADGGRNGAFAGVTSNLAFLSPVLTYDPNNVYLTLNRNSIDFAGIGGTRNQRAAGGGVESLGWGHPIYAAVLQLDAPAARNAFDAISGEIHASAKTALIEDSRFVRDAAIDRIRSAFAGVAASSLPVMAYGPGGPQAIAPTADRLAFWGQGFGSWGHTGTDGNAARLHRSTDGFLIGADTPAFETWRLGLITGYSLTNFNAPDRQSSGSSDNYHLGLYGGTRWGALGLRTGVAHTWHNISTGRSAVFPGFADNLSGKYDAGTFQAFGDLGYRIDTLRASFEPFANLAYVNLNTGGFAEQGGAAALHISGQISDTTFTTLGLRASTGFALHNLNLTARGSLGWRHAFGETTPLSGQAFFAGDPFTVAGVPIARDAAAIESGLDLKVTTAATLGVSYSSQFASGASDQSVRANFEVRF